MNEWSAPMIYISASWSVKGIRFLILKEIHDQKIDWLQKYFLADY